MRCIVVLLLFGPCLASDLAVAQILDKNFNIPYDKLPVSAAPAGNWKVQAKKNLTIRKDKKWGDLSDADLEKARVCVRYNNYWCLKFPKDRETGNFVSWDFVFERDEQNHAKFTEAKHSARAAARNLRTWYYQDSRNTVLRIAFAYAPPTDCKGSIGIPPLCPYGVNDPDDYAKQLKKMTGINPNQQLVLFNAKKQLSPVGIKLLQGMSRIELGNGMMAGETVIRQGVDKEYRDFVRDPKKDRFRKSSKKPVAMY